jgi:cytoskeletal protein CcmA (bactofilin family)
MAELRVRTIDESELDTVLAEDFDFEGTIEFSEPLLIKGAVKGEVRSHSDLFIAESAHVEANVRASRVTVKGTIRGDVDATDRIELFAGAGIIGNIRTPDLIVQSGSRLSGCCEMPEPGAATHGEGTSPGTAASNSPASNTGADLVRDGSDEENADE